MCGKWPPTSSRWPTIITQNESMGMFVTYPLEGGVILIGFGLCCRFTRIAAAFATSKSKMVKTHNVSTRRRFFKQSISRFNSYAACELSGYIESVLDLASSGYALGLVLLYIPLI